MVGASGSLEASQAFPLLFTMGQQLNKIIKRRRRKAYLARKKALAKSGAARSASRTSTKKPAAKKAAPKKPAAKKAKPAAEAAEG